MPHKHSPKSKHSRAKRRRFKLLREYCRLPKIWDAERLELISLKTSKNFESGEVLKSPRFISPSLKRLELEYGGFIAQSKKRRRYSILRYDLRVLRMLERPTTVYDITTRLGYANSTAYPVSSSLSRPLIASKLVEVAELERAEAVAHGCSGIDLPLLYIYLISYPWSPGPS